MNERYWRHVTRGLTAPQRREAYEFWNALMVAHAQLFIDMAEAVAGLESFCDEMRGAGANELA